MRSLERSGRLERPIVVSLSPSSADDDDRACLNNHTGGRVPRDLILRVAIALIALIEAFSGWMDLVIVGGILNKPDLSSRGLIALAPMVLHLLLALAAAVFGA